MASLGAILILIQTGAQGSENAETPQAPTPEVTSHGPGVSLPALLAEIGPRLHRNFLLDPRAASDKVDLINLRQQDITYPQLLSLLGVYGLIVVSNGTTAQIIPNTDVRLAALPLVPPDNVKIVDDEPVTSIIAVKGISAPQLVPILRPLIPQWGHLAAISDRNALILIDRTANVKRIIEIIRTLETLPKTVPSDQPKSP
jgi:general secretion pathway protein D